METRFTEIRKSLRGRWQAGWPKEGNFGRLEAVMHGALNAVAKLEEERAALAASGRLSAKGLTEEARKHALANTIAPLHRAAQAVEAVRADLAQRRAQLAVPKSDPSDTAGGLLRGEMRAWLRTLGPGQVMATLLDEKADGRLVQAALEGPPGMSGLTVATQVQVREQNAARMHGPEMDQLDQLNEAADLVDAAVTTSLYQLRKETDFPENQMIAFDRWMESATAEIERVPERPSVPAHVPAPASIVLDTSFIDEAFDRVWAEHFPQLYPDHPINQAKKRA